MEPKGSFTSARHLSLSWATLIQSMLPHPTSWRSVLLLSSHLCLDLPYGLFLSGFPTKTLYTPLLTPIHATFPAHLIRLHFTTWTIQGEEYRSLSFSLCSFLHSLLISPLLGPNILLNTTLEHSQPIFLPQFKQPNFMPTQNNRQNYSSAHLKIFKFLNSNLEDKKFCTIW